VHVVRDDLLAERLARDLGAGEEIARVAQRGRDARQRRVAVGIAFEDRRQLERGVDSVKPGGDDRRERHVGVEVGAADAVLKAKRGALSDHTQRAGAVVTTPSDRGRRERPGGVALVGVDVRGEQQRELAQRCELAGEEGVEDTIVAREQRPLASPSEKWIWQELPSRSLSFAMKVIDMPSCAAISLAPFL